jgi:hypothetical protein
MFYKKRHKTNPFINDMSSLVNRASFWKNKKYTRVMGFTTEKMPSKTRLKASCCGDDVRASCAPLWGAELLTLDRERFHQGWVVQGAVTPCSQEREHLEALASQLVSLSEPSKEPVSPHPGTGDSGYT